MKAIDVAPVDKAYKDYRKDYPEPRLASLEGGEESKSKEDMLAWIKRQYETHRTIQWDTSCPHCKRCPHCGRR